MKTLYALLDNNGGIEKYPFNISELRKYVSMRDNPSTETLAEYGVVKVEPTERPLCDYTKNVKEAEPCKTNSGWVQSWKIEPASKKEREERIADKEKEVREIRNSLLSSSDWTQLPDSCADKAAWSGYRSELRDITSQPGFPWSVEWPQPPSPSQK